MAEQSNERIVQGLGTFQQYFLGQEEKFIIVGGTAIQLVRGQYKGLEAEFAGVVPRVTHDIDVLVVLEKLDQDFVDAMQKLIKDGQYMCEKKHEANYFYRFTQKVDVRYPKKIELLTRNPFPEDEDFRYASITGEFKGSLSAIVLSPEYYDFAKCHARMINGLYSLTEIGLIVLKASASMNQLEEYLKLLEQNKNGDYFKLDYIKHLQDVFLLVGELSPDVHEAVVDPIRARMKQFIDRHGPMHYTWNDTLKFVNDPSGDPMAYIDRFKEALELR